MTFRGAYDFLSNMYTVDFEWDGRVYHSSEAAFQSAKSLDPEERERFTVMNGVTAKRAGKKVNLRSDWERVKDAVMEDVVRAKFTQNPELAQRLIATGDMELVEGNRWHDSYWGYDLISKKGENHLGKILMKIREELGGESYRVAVEQKRMERAQEKQAERDHLHAQLSDIQKQLDALPECEFVGRKWNTKAFGKVTILRREGNYLYFEAGGAEKQFVLPVCITNGFLTPEDPEIVGLFQKRQELQSSRKALEKQLELLG
ncbi:MAG: NADAR family protein [Clostridia bacterium]|nr:NADAR family protein [Clostridia bacterium]